jgi:hypothetical protein
MTAHPDDGDHEGPRAHPDDASHKKGERLKTILARADFGRSKGGSVEDDPLWSTLPANRLRHIEPVGCIEFCNHEESNLTSVLESYGK